jgi:hypothetical protein
VRQLSGAKGLLAQVGDQSVEPAASRSSRLITSLLDQRP